MNILGLRYQVISSISRDYSTHSWLQVDLGATTHVFRVALLHLEEDHSLNRLRDIEVRVGDFATEGGRRLINYNTLCNTAPHIARLARNWVFECQERPTQGRFITFQRREGEK